MMIELQGIDMSLQAWKLDPLAPREKISPFTADHTGNRAEKPFSVPEIEKMLEIFRSNAPMRYTQLFADQNEVESLLASMQNTGDS